MQGMGKDLLRRQFPSPTTKHLGVIKRWACGEIAPTAHASPPRVLGAEHEERALPWGVPILLFQGIYGFGRSARAENSAISRHYAPVRGPWGYPTLGMGREPHHGWSLSPTHKDSGVLDTRHGGRGLRHGPSLSPSQRDAGLANAVHKLPMGHPCPPLGGVLRYLALGMGKDLRHGQSPCPTATKRPSETERNPSIRHKHGCACAYKDARMCLCVRVWVFVSE